MQSLPHITLETGPNPRGAVIWLHGLGADGHDFEPIVLQLGLPRDMPLRFIFPHAPAMPVTINGGYVMPAWYDIRRDDLGVEHDEAGIMRSALAIQALIEQQNMKGIDNRRIVLAGFSQGAAMALHLGLRLRERLAGIIALSGYLLLPARLAKEATRAALETPVFMAHGLDDPIVPITLAEAAHDRLARLGVEVAWHTYPMAHQVCPEEVRAIGRWLQEILSSPATSSAST
ncbi:MAG: carboxylesterase [Zetaproteobacteria bacterium]|nr:MAG: carboxylesterase [Zetaproteobacteria bacterium]